MVQTKSRSEVKGDAIRLARARGYYTGSQAALLLNTSFYTIQKVLLEGRLRGCKINRSWRITVPEMERFLREGPADPNSLKWSVSDDPFPNDQVGEDD